MPEGMVWRSTGGIERRRAATVTMVDELVHVANQLTLALERLLEHADEEHGLWPESRVEIWATVADVELARAALDLAGELDRDWSKLLPPAS